MGEVDAAEELTVAKCKEWWESKVADEYFTAYSFGFSKPELIEKMGLVEGSKVLELGPGYGRETSQFCKITPEVYVTDLSTSALELVKKHAEVKGAKDYDGVTLPWEDTFFDFVYSCFVMQHMSKVSAGVLMKESLRVLAPEGFILHEFFQNDNYLNGEDGDYLSDGIMFNNSWSPEKITAMVESLGGTVVWIETVDHGILANEPFDTFNHWVCVRKQ